MKLFLLEINNGWEYGDYEERHKLVAAKNKAKAAIKAIEFMNEHYESSMYNTPEYDVTDISEVDGYRVRLFADYNKVGEVDD